MGLVRGRRLGRGSALQEFVFSLGRRHGASADDTWLFSANVAYENLRDERLQSGGGGLASGIVPIPQPDGSTVNKLTFFQREFNEWAGSIAAQAQAERPLCHGQFQHVPI